jgi:cytochrome d ubiquinol oxidase subunit I
MSNVIAARAQMGTSLGFHIVFASLGVGLPLLMCLAEGLGLWRRDPVWYQLAQRWTKAFAILYAIGAVSGTILSFELGLLWPRFMHFAGGIIGLPFAMEAFAFFTEGIFLGLYLYGWNRLSPLVHWLCSFPLWIAGLFSALFVVTANAWMNTPTGFVLTNGQVSHVDPVAAILNPSTPTSTLHMAAGAYEATVFGAAAVYALILLFGHRDAYLRKGLLLAVGLGSIMAPLQIWLGDANAKVVAAYQPTKLAAMEALFKTTKGAPESIFGWPDLQHSTLNGAIRVPKLLSWLVSGDPNATVKGLEAVPRSDWPPVLVVHYAFNVMVGIGFAALALTLWYWLWHFWGRHHLPEYPFANLTLLAVALMGPATFAAVELGWITTCMGRQPWIIYQDMLVSQAVTPAPGLKTSFVIFTAIYILLGVTTTVLLVRLAREGRGTPTPRVPIERIPALEGGAV